jgi:succinate dehydrogenase/fumarate reductase flavoprotein subunit
MSEKLICTDVLVIGAGMAGFFAALKAKELGMDVVLADKAYAGESGSSYYALGEILYFRQERNHKLEEWVNHISKSGEYLNNREWVEICLKESADRQKDLLSWNIPFETKNGEMIISNSDSLGRVSTIERVHMVPGQYTPLLRKKSLESGVRVVDRIMLCELLKQDDQVMGAIGFNTNSGDLYIFQAKAIVIATGSSSLKAGNHLGHYWTGDGETMAYRAGAEISGMEFAFGMFGDKFGGTDRTAFKQREQNNKGTLISGKINDLAIRFPYIRGAGQFFPLTLNAEGRPLISPAWEAHCGQAPVYMDLDSIPRELLEIPLPVPPNKLSIDITKGGKVQCSGANIKTISVPGGAGIWPIDKTCATGIAGLYAAGNTCATMMSGALYAGMGFGLNHAAVTGNRAGLGAAEHASKAKKPKIDEAELKRVKKIVCEPMERKGGFTPAWLTQVLHSITVPYFYLQVKHGERLRAALTIAEFINSHLVPKLTAKDAHEWRMSQETKNMALIAEMMLRTSLFRTESRGSHFREDYPRRDDPTWLAWIKVKDEYSRMKIGTVPIPKEWWPDLSKPYEERYPTMLPGE